MVSNVVRPTAQFTKTKWQPLEAVPVVAFDQDAAAAYAPVRFATRERTTDGLDKLIAAHALRGKFQR